MEKKESKEKYEKKKRDFARKIEVKKKVSKNIDSVIADSRKDKRDWMH